MSYLKPGAFVLRGRLFIHPEVYRALTGAIA